MAGLFNIFREVENAPMIPNSRGKENTLLKSARSVETLMMKIPQPMMKPKGLSIRSKSDLNVSSLANFGANRLGSKDKQLLSSKPVSPLKLFTPKKNIENYFAKKLSPKISSPIRQNVDEYVFKKPATPKSSKKSDKYPESEILAGYFDPSQYLNDEMTSMFEEDALLLRSIKSADTSNDSIAIEEDSGFLSDPAFDSLNHSLEYLSMPSLPSMSDIELPEISDIED